MNKTRLIGLSALAVLVALGTGWAIEKSTLGQAKPAVVAPAKAGDAASKPATREPEIQPAAVDSNQEYDRSDLLLSQG